MLRLIKMLLPYIRPHWKMALSSFLLAIPLAAIKGYETYLVKDIFDKGLASQTQFSEAVKLALLLLFLGILNYPVRFFHFYWIRYVVDKATCLLRSRIFSKMQELPLSSFNQNKQGVLLSYVMNDSQVLSVGFRSIIDLIREPLTALVLFSLALYRDWQLTLVIIVVAPIFAIIFSKSGRRIRKNIAEVQENVAEMSHRVSEGLAGQKMAKAFNLQNYLLKRFDKSQDLYFTSQMETTFIEENAHPLVELVGAFAFCAVILFAHHRISSGELTPGGFISFVTALALLMDPIRKFSQANVRLNQALAAGDRLSEVLEIPGEFDGEDKKIGRPDFRFSREIIFDNVSFSYGDHDVIRNFSFVLKKGEKAAFVGPSGSGKSTLLSLLMGFYPLTKGNILIDGISINDFQLKDLRSLFSYVGQDVFLFHDSIEENIVTGKSVGPNKLEKALNISYAGHFIQDLVLKEKTVIGDRGTRLSGGQAQRVTIARAFLYDAPVFLFDEATSALDNESEKIVQKAMEEVSGEKTVLAVAHRLSTIQNYDKIVVLNRGEKVEEGTHKELMERQGDYYRLYQLGQK